MAAASECGVRLGQQISTIYILLLLRVSAAYPGLVEHVGHLVDSVQQHVHLALHVLPLPLALLDRVLEHLEVARLPHHLRLHLLLVLLHADNLGLQSNVRVRRVSNVRGRQCLLANSCYVPLFLFI